MKKEKEKKEQVFSPSMTTQTNQKRETSEQIEELKEEYTEKVKEKKERRGRKKKEVIERKEEFASTLSFSSSLFLDFVCKRLPNPIPVSDDERKLFSSSINAISNKYFHVLGQFDAELSLLISCLIIFVPRLIVKKDAESNTDIWSSGKRENNVSEETAI